jgi:serine/threonine protein kinase
MKELKLQKCRLDDRYNITECLGRGSYAEIYLAQDPIARDDSLNKIVVIKALNVLLQGDIDSDLERTLTENFQNEAIALDRVRHRNIINRLGHGTAIDLNGTIFHYLVLEYLPGGDIFKLCKNQPMPLKTTIYYLEQVCAGLAHAHEKGVIHRDIKPQNLLLTSDRLTVKIADFGVAKIGAHEGNITRVGTNIYAAPEHNPQLQTAQLASGETNFVKPKLTPAADIYSLAKTVYVMLTGESPRRFESHSIKDLPLTISKQPWANEVLRVLQKATKTNPIERFQSVKEFLEEFTRATSTANLTAINANESIDSLTIEKTDFEKDIKEIVDNAPPRPRFDSTRNLQNQNVLLKESERPRIVVQFNDSQPLNQQPIQPVVQNAYDIINKTPDAAAQQKEQRKQKPQSTLASGFKSFLVGVCLIIAFTTMLLATHYFFRGRAIWNSGTTTNNTDPIIGREGTTTANVNLRPDPSAKNKSIGIAEKGTTVKILAVSGDWYRVQITNRPRPKNPNWADEGWIHKDYIDFD